MKTIQTMGPDGVIIDLPVPTTVNRATQIFYQLLLALVAAGAISALMLSYSPILWFGCTLLVLPLPLHWYVEYKIRRTTWQHSQRRRGLLFGAEMALPLLTMPALPTVHLMLEAHDITPTEKQFSILMSCGMILIGLTNILANRAWALNKLGLER